jgi:hypothetical protein
MLLRSHLVWRQAAQSALTPQVFAAIVHALEALNVRSLATACMPALASQFGCARASQVGGQSHARWQARCSVFQHAAAAAGSARDAYLVSLSGDAQAPGYVILRREGLSSA